MYSNPSSGKQLVQSKGDHLAEGQQMALKGVLGPSDRNAVMQGPNIFLKCI